MTYSTHARIAALVTAGFLTATGGTAYADTVTNGNGSTAGGNQAMADLDAPFSVCGDAIAVLGVAGAQCSGSGAEVGDDGSDTATSGDGSLLGGNQIGADGDIPVNLCGDAVGVGGVAGADCTDSGAGTGDQPDDGSTDKSEDPGYEEPPEEESPGEEPPGHGEDPEESEDDSGDGGGPGDGGGDTPGNNGGGTPEESVFGPVEDEEASTSALAQTGTDGNVLTGLLASAAAAIAAGVGFLLFGRRRRASA